MLKPSFRSGDQRKSLWRRLSPRAVAFLLWLLIVTGGPGVCAAIAEVGVGPSWFHSLPYLGLLCALVSLVLVERPDSISLRAYAAQLHARLLSEAREPVRPTPATQVATTKETQ